MLFMIKKRIKQELARLFANRSFRTVERALIRYTSNPRNKLRQVGLAFDLKIYGPKGHQEGTIVRRMLLAELGTSLALTKSTSDQLLRLQGKFLKRKINRKEFSKAARKVIKQTEDKSRVGIAFGLIPDLHKKGYAVCKACGGAGIRK